LYGVLPNQSCHQHHELSLLLNEHDKEEDMEEEAEDLDQ